MSILDHAADQEGITSMAEKPAGARSEARARAQWEDGDGDGGGASKVDRKWIESGSKVKVKVKVR